MCAMAAEQPKKPMSAYFMYFDEHRAAIAKQLGEKAKQKGILAKTAAEQWRELTEDKKAPYEKRYAEAKIEYDKAVEAFKAGGGEIVRKRKADKNEKPKKDKNAPKKPSGGGYGVYLAEHRGEIMKSLPAGSNGIFDVTKAAGAQWKALSEAQRKPYENKYQIKMQEYVKAIEAYKAAKGATEDRSDEEEDQDAEEEEEEEEIPAAKKGKVTQGSKVDVMAEVKELGYTRQFKLISENAKLSGTSAEKILAALKSSDGGVPAAKKALLGA